jgi:phage gpG-like protein
MAARFKLSFYGDVQLDRTLARMQENPKDARPLWEALANRFAAIETRQFKSAGRYASGGWSPLSPRYAAWKAKHYPGAPILTRTAALRNSLTRRPFGVDIIEHKSMAVGSDVDYGKYHQNGEGNNPQRRAVELTENERRRWMRALQRYVITGEASVK